MACGGEIFKRGSAFCKIQVSNPCLCKTRCIPSTSLLTASLPVMLRSKWRLASYPCLLNEHLSTRFAANVMVIYRFCRIRSPANITASLLRQSLSFPQRPFKSLQKQSLNSLVREVLLAALPASDPNATFVVSSLTTKSRARASSSGFNSSRTMPGSSRFRNRGRVGHDWDFHCHGLDQWDGKPSCLLAKRKALLRR